MSQNDPDLVRGMTDVFLRDAGARGVRLTRAQVRPWASKFVSLRDDPEARKKAVLQFAEKFGISTEPMVNHAEHSEKPAGPLRLPPEYDEACLGHSLDPRGAEHSRFIYSMTRMVKIRNPVDPQDGAESVWKYILEIAREHGGRMPVFVEDSEVENAPKLWTPPGS